MVKELQNLGKSRAMIVCSAGGHLAEALLLARKLGLSEESCFITHKNPQSESLLEQVKHEYIAYVKSRQIFGALKGYFELRRIYKKNDFDVILSTGAAISISALILHLVSRKPFYYNETLTRVVAPSFSGRVLQLFPSVKLYSPHARNFSKKWQQGPSLLDKYRKIKGPESKKKSINLLVSLGTMSPYRFDRLIDQLLPCLEVTDNVTWQLGCTTRIGLPGNSLDIISNNEFLDLAFSADVVICHGGVGSLLDLITHGIRPIVIPRLMELDEHVDNHQVELADYFGKLDLIHVPVSTITRFDLIECSGFRITSDK